MSPPTSPASGREPRRSSGPRATTAARRRDPAGHWFAGAKTGIFALEDVDLFNILNLPESSDVGVLTERLAYAEERRSMILIDIAGDVDTLDEARDWIATRPTGGCAIAMPPPISRACAWPTRCRTTACAPSPTRARSPGSTPAPTPRAASGRRRPGPRPRLRGVQALDYVLTDPENGVLNPLGLNCLRTFPVFGTVGWGARTLVGADALTTSGSTFRCAASRSSSRRASTAAPSGWCSSPTTSRSGRRSG